MSELPRTIIEKQLVDKYGNYHIEIDPLRASDGKYQEITSYGVDQEIVAVPKDSRIHLFTLVIHNKEASEITVTLKDGTDQAYPTIPVPAGEIMFLTEKELKGLVFKSSIVVNIGGTYTNGTEIFVGYLVEYNGEI